MDPFKINSITKLKTRQQNIYIKFLWNNNDDDLFHIKIFDGNNSWSGKFSLEEENQENCPGLEVESKEEYKENVRKCLLGKLENFAYDFVILPNSSSTARFSWNKVFEDSTEMTHGAMLVHLDDETESKDYLIDFLLNENNELREVIQVYDRRNNAITANLEKCKSELESFVHLKTSLETSLYGKFVQILNEKKRRIKLLEENLEKYE